MKTYSELSEGIFGPSDNDVYRFSKHVDYEEKKSGNHYPIVDSMGKEIPHGTKEHRKAFFSDPLKHESYRHALRSLSKNKEVDSTELARQAWHTAAKKKIKQDPAWGEKTNSFKPKVGTTPILFSKKENINAGPSTQGLHSALIKAGVHEKEATKYVGLDKQYGDNFKNAYNSMKGRK